MNVLLVEDDRDLGRLIDEELKSRRYQSWWVQTCQEAYQVLLQNEFDLAVVDLNLPDGEGFEIVPRLHCPVIIMSALSGPQNRLKGVEMGAVDFIPKPFLLQELFIKIERLRGSQVKNDKRWQLEGVVLDLLSRQILNAEETHLLNKRDYRLLEILTRRYPQVVSRNEIIDYVYGKDQNPSHRTIDNAVVGIRQMLSDVKHRWIRSVRGEGYQWMLESE